MRLLPVLSASILMAAFCLCGRGQNTETKQVNPTEMKGMPPRASAADYSAQAQAGKVTIGADFTGHSVPKPEGPLTTEDYVVVEIGLFGAPDQRIQLALGDFSLRINGKKSPFPRQPFGLVAGSLKDPQWSPPEEAEAKPKSKTGLSANGQSDSSMPVVVHVPIELRHAMARYVQGASLHEGDRSLPEAGLIFFQYRGNTSKIHSLELLYSGSAGNATLTLQP
jgi:hypothetical protein